jgi:CDGSH-type Zn-finger protein
VAIETVEDLRQHLQWAIELEHSTLPPYLTALYSIKDGANQTATEIVHSVFTEEMLHLTLAANILNAVGGSPNLDHPGIIPSYPTFLAHSNNAFRIGLTKFSKEALETFLQIERPAEHDGLPEDDNFETVGQFYEAIEEAMQRLAGEMGEAGLFCGDRARQVTDTLYYGGAGRIIAVTDLASALRALKEIVEQGEGVQHREIWDGDCDMFHPERDEVAHYFRFNELYVGRRYTRGDTPQSGPTGEPVEVDWDAVWPMRPNPRTADYPDGSPIRAQLQEFNHAYTAVLHLLHESFNGSPGLLAVATGLMYGLKDEATKLMSMPSGDGATTVGPSFEWVPPRQRHLTGSTEPKIVVIKDGPYLVYGNVPLSRKKKITSAQGNSISWRKTGTIETEETYALCRCGMSSSKPFCDGSHVRNGFDGTEAADTRPSIDRTQIVEGSLTEADGETGYEGQGLVVKRDRYLCMHAAFCVGRLMKIPEMMAGVDDSDVRAAIIGRMERCPSGSYMYALTPGGEDVEPDYPLGIAVTAEQDELAGALWVTGGIPVTRSDGQPFETRPRMTLCRCGHSKAKPLCDGTHHEIDFRDSSEAAAATVA